MVRPRTALLLTLLLAGCTSEQEAASEEAIERGRTALRGYGCGSCHAIPGVAGANGRVGPPLERIAERGYIGGVLPNDRDNLIRWIREPEAVDPRTAMPNVGVSAEDAEDIASYLYQIR